MDVQLIRIRDNQFFATALIGVRLLAVQRLGQVRHQWQVEEPVSQADKDRLKPRPDLWAHPPVRVRSTRRGGRDSAAKEQCQAYRCDDNQYSRSCHTGGIARQSLDRYRHDGVWKTVMVSTGQRITTGEMMRDRGGIDGQ